jgi:hypothetical protein
MSSIKCHALFGRVGNPSAATRQFGVSGLGFPGARLFQPLEGSVF